MFWKTIELSLTLFLCFIVETNSSRIRIQGTEYKDAVVNEYIVAINTHKLKTDVETYRDVKETTAKEFRDYLSNNVPNRERSNIRRTLIFPNYVVFEVSMDPEDVHLIQEHPLVSFIETNHKLTAYNNTLNVTGNVTLNDRSCLRQDTGRTLWGLSRISNRKRVNRVSDYTYVESDGQGVDIYILDTGIRIGHEDFGGRAVHGFTAPRIDFNEGPDDLHGHGTHIAGTAGGTTYGVAKQANLISVKILDKNGIGYSGDMIEGLQWVHADISQKQAARGRRAKSVINMSLGSRRDQIQTSVEVFMLDIASDLGVVFVTAAGNSYGDDACYFSPARISWAITVGASDYDDSKSDFSNTGPCVDIFAPGSDVLSAAIDSNDATQSLHGTSMATPHVTGVVARYLSKVCEMPSPAAVKAWLLNLATQDVLVLDANTPNKLLYMPCFWDGSPVEAGSIIIQESEFRYDIILFTLVLGFGVLLLLSLGAITLSYVTYKSTRLHRALGEVPEKNSKTKKYRISQADKTTKTNVGHSQTNGAVPIQCSDDEYTGYNSTADNMGFHGDDYDVIDVQSNGSVYNETDNGIAVITQDPVISRM